MKTDKSKKIRRRKFVKKPGKSRQMQGLCAEQTPAWKGGVVYIDGRRWIYKPDHPNASHNNRYVQESRLAMSNYLERSLTPREIVHHINGDPNDNRIENLQLMTRAEHNALHFSSENMCEKTRELHRQKANNCKRNKKGQFVKGG